MCSIFRTRFLHRTDCTQHNNHTVSFGIVGKTQGLHTVRSTSVRDPPLGCLRPYVIVSQLFHIDCFSRALNNVSQDVSQLIFQPPLLPCIFGSLYLPMQLYYCSCVGAYVKLRRIPAYAVPAQRKVCNEPPSLVCSSSPTVQQLISQSHRGVAFPAILYVTDAFHFGAPAAEFLTIPICPFRCRDTRVTLSEIGNMCPSSKH